MVMRVEGVEAAALETVLARLETFLAEYADETDFRYAGAYIERSYARFALGQPLVDVIDDLWLASRCLRGRAELHLYRHPLERLRTRRIEPIEIGIIGGQADVMLEIATGYAFPLVKLLAHTATQEERNEGAHCSSFFSTERVQSLRDLVGLGAAVYSASLGAVIQGDYDEAELGLNLFRDAARAVGVEGGAADPPALLRYVRLNRALRQILAEDREGLVETLDELTVAYARSLAPAQADGQDEWARPERAAAYFDTSTVALMGTALLKGLSLNDETMTEAGRAAMPFYWEMKGIDRSEFMAAEAEARASRAREQAAAAGVQLGPGCGETAQPCPGDDGCTAAPAAPAVETPADSALP